MVPNVDISVGVMSGNKHLLIATYFKVFINLSLCIRMNRIKTPRTMK